MKFLFAVHMADFIPQQPLTTPYSSPLRL